MRMLTAYPTIVSLTGFRFADVVKARNPLQFSLAYWIVDCAAL